MYASSFQIHVTVSVVAGPLCCLDHHHGETEQKWGQAETAAAFPGGQFTIPWGFSLLMVCLLYFGDEQLYGHLHLETVIEQELPRKCVLRLG